jgi:hypothetical protein
MALQIEGSSESPQGVWKKRLAWTLGIILAVFLSLWAISATVDLTIWGAYNRLIDTLCDRLAINHYLANALSFLFIVPFFVGVKYYLFSLRDRARKQKIGLILLLGMGVLYNSALYFGTRNQNFGPSGAVRYYALVPGGVVFSDRPGTEPQYGVPFRLVTTENIKWLLRIQRGSIEYVPDPGHHDWFDRVTGDPMLWYSTDGKGNFRFFDGPGHDPASQAELKPVTPSIRGEWEKSAAAAAAATVREAPDTKGGNANTPAENPKGPSGDDQSNSNIQTSQPEATVAETYQKVFADDFLLELHSCVLRGQNLICGLTVTNDLNSDREFFLRIYWGSASRVFDEDGNEYVSQRGQLGRQSGTPGISGFGESLLPAVKTKASLEFEKIAPNVKLAKVLRIVFSTDGYHEQTADFRDVPIQTR